MKKFRKVSALFLTVVLCVTAMDFHIYARETKQSAPEAQEKQEQQNGWDGVTTKSIFEGENYKVTYSLTSRWEGSYNASIKIENTGDTVIHDWYLGYDFSHEITGIWNAEVNQIQDLQCIIKNAGWNQDIAVGGSVEYGFSAKGDFNGFPLKYELSGQNAEAGTEDYDITYHMDSDWGNGFTGSVSITNKTDKILEDWVLEFDFGRTIQSIWNGVV